MNKKTAVLNLIMRIERKRKIRNIALAVSAAILIGWVLTYAQQQAFSLTPPAPGQVEGDVATPESEGQAPAKD